MTKDGITLNNIRHPRGKPALGDLNPDSLETVEIDLPEPVAWGVFEGNLHDMFFTQSEAQEMAKLKGTHAEVRPLYAAPQRTEQEQKPMHPEMRKMWEDHFDKCFAESAPQRTWVSLTDEERINISYKADGNECVAVELTEAKLKEKNT